LISRAIATQFPWRSISSNASFAKSILFVQEVNQVPVEKLKLQLVDTTEPVKNFNPL